MSACRALLAAVFIPLLAGAECSVHDEPGPQGWSAAQQQAWYTASQGSRLIPQSWLHALEQPGNGTAFLDPGYIQQLRYLPGTSAHWVSPDPRCPYDPSLPLGFTVDCQSDAALSVTKLRWKTGQSDREPWVGLNCSACHTAALEYGGQRIIVDGGPTLADFQSFTENLDLALQATVSDDAKFGRFADKVLGAAPAAGDSQALRGAVQARLNWDGKLAAMNAAPIRYGFGRLDAVGHILNKAALVAMPDGLQGDPAQLANPADAPVSYPFIWNVTQLDRVEWDGVLPNHPFTFAGTFDAGALVRNTGEVIGVFADIVPVPNAGLAGYHSSINLVSLADMEQQLRYLRPPVWPAAFGAINTDLAETGAALFKTQHCDACHTVPKTPFSPDDSYTVAMTPVGSADPKTDHPVGTDMWMTCNAVFDTANTGLLAGTKVNVVEGAAMPETTDSLGLVQNEIIGGFLGQKQELAEAAVTAIFGLTHGLPVPRPQGFALINPKEARRNQCLYAQTHASAKNHAALVYKGRPLQGIWATAPYLHNGSVPTLWDLLLPPAQRPKDFYTGTRAFDPKKVGFVTEASAENSFHFVAADPVTGQMVDGNGNGGHDYNNAGLTDDQRWALVEYMKTL